MRFSFPDLMVPLTQFKMLCSRARVRDSALGLGQNNNIVLMHLLLSSSQLLLKVNKKTACI